VQQELRIKIDVLVNSYTTILRVRVYNIIIIHCLTSDTDPMRPTQTTLYIGETCKFIGRKPLIY
jgi:hypothetical protein